MECMMCGWTAQDFWAATLGDIGALFTAHGKRSKQLWHLGAWHAAHLINVHIPHDKPSVTPRQLLGEPEPLMDPAMFGSADDYIAYLDAMVAKCGATDG